MDGREVTMLRMIIMSYEGNILGHDLSDPRKLILSDCGVGQSKLEIVVD